MRKPLNILLALFWVLLLSGCNSTVNDAKSTAQQFWSAIVADDMETAKNLATWESVQYLSYMKTAQLIPQRFELGELVPQSERTEVVTLLYGGALGGSMQTPIKTVVVRSGDVWRVDVKQTLGSVVSGTVGTVAGELSTLFQESLKGLDQAVGKTLQDFSSQLNQGVDQLNRELKVIPQGMKDLDAAVDNMGKALNGLGDQLNQGLDQLNRELEKTPHPNLKQPESKNSSELI